MNRRFIGLLLLIILPCFAVSAQQVKVTYENRTDTLSDLMKQYFQMQGLESFRLTLKGDFNGKRAIIKKVTCDKGVFIEKQLLSEYQHLILTDSIETLDFMALPYGNDSIRISCFYPMGNNQRLFLDILPKDQMKILMETYTAGAGPGTPIMAYTTGLPIEGGGIWFCGLRDSGVEPRLWYEKYKIDGYVFYEVTLEEDTPPDENTPFYIKIAKSGSYAAHN